METRFYRIYILQFYHLERKSTKIDQKVVFDHTISMKHNPAALFD